MAMSLLDLISPKWSATTATRRDILLKNAKALRNQDYKNKESTEGLIQIVDNCKKGLGYNAVPPPYTGNFMPPTPDLSFTCLDKFVDKPVVENKKSDEEVSKGNPQMDLQDHGVIDSGCSRNMTGNMSYLTDYEEIDGVYVAFGGNPKGGKITGKGADIAKIFKKWLKPGKHEHGNGGACKQSRGEMLYKKVQGQLSQHSVNHGQH
ncbi:hypothetical protein Tco_1033181 [Tanacetum coccineum]|uniref:Uncharacterized protein n=1 Tax=Tanacetum coccineum TaxID=301880 RepID=A0ABQ5GDX6_9ASTR